VVDDIRAREQRLDVLVNNAGLFHTQPLPETSETVFARLHSTNQLGVLLGMQASLPLLMAARGTIVNIASTAGIRGVSNAIAYSATKWAVRGMTRAAAVEFAPHGIRVNCVVPGLIDTRMAHLNDPAALEAFIGTIPLARMGESHEVAAATVFLASKAASYITGTDIVVDGGDTA
jgi:3alpha(or 20beta)-hydroxysteroid dehydrogenase